ncbi:F-box/FBD/LRR-repeat protein [Trifolium repens]|nr:F-box/FBD/LRR-repeat protein [Trifolium repens]
MENSAPIDRISNLPDELLSHILSFLPTKLAFTTTVLSKRWTPLFKLLTSLHFDDEYVPDKDSFLHFCRFVDTVTLSTKLIKTFHLKCSYRHWWCNDSFDVNSWIETVKRHPLENLQIVSSFIIPFPSSIFIFPALVVLKLDMLKVVADISVQSVVLPSLKTLHLIFVHFKNKQNFYNLLYGCPVLENLVANIHYLEEVKDVTVSVQDFKAKLISADVDAFDVPLTVISNVNILKLKMMKYRDPWINFTGFSVFRNLTNLQLYIFDFPHWDYIVEVLQYCPKLQILYLKKWEINKSINWKYPKHVPECISFELKSCTIVYEGRENDIRFTKYILQNARILEVMKITINPHSSPKPNPQLLEELSLCPMISSQCKLSILG